MTLQSSIRTGGGLLALWVLAMSDARIYVGECRSVLSTIEPGRARACITSPPFWGLRDYDIEPVAWPEVAFTPMPGLEPVTVPAQIAVLGMERDPLAYVAHMVLVFREVHRVLSEDGTLWLNLGDSYVGSAGGYQGKNGQRASRTFTARIRLNKSGSGLKRKDLVGMPWRVAMALQADGWFLRDDVIWVKRNPMPESVHDRCTKAHEHVFMLTKSPRYHFDGAAIAEEATCRAPGNLDRGKYESDDPRLQTKRNKHKIKAGAKRNARNTWSLPSEPFKGAHFAVMPARLAARCIAASTRSGDVVLDPFAGACTTGLAARRMSRAFVGIEMNAMYAQIGAERIHTEAPIFGRVEVLPLTLALLTEARSA